MGFVQRIWKDPVISAVIATLIVTGIGSASAHFAGVGWADVWRTVSTIIPFPIWAIGLWVALTIAAIIYIVRDLFHHSAPNVEFVSPSATHLHPPKIEIFCSEDAPYRVSDVQGGRVLSTVRIGIRNSGGKTLSNCKVFIEKIVPRINSPRGDVLLLEGHGFQLRHDDPEKLLDVAAHWYHIEKFKFNTPTGAGFFRIAEYMEDGVQRNFVVKVAALESERSALFKIWADSSKGLHLKFINYI